MTVVLGFVFAITTRSTIEQEPGAGRNAACLGAIQEASLSAITAMPIIVTLIAAVIGNSSSAIRCLKMCAPACTTTATRFRPTVTVWVPRRL